MSREEIMECVAEYFGIENETGEYDIRDYDWQAGCYMGNGRFLSLGEVVKCIESFIYDI